MNDEIKCICKKFTCDNTTFVKFSEQINIIKKLQFKLKAIKRISAYLVKAKITIYFTNNLSL